MKAVLTCHKCSAQRPEAIRGHEHHAHPQLSDQIQDPMRWDLLLDGQLNRRCRVCNKSRQENQESYTYKWSHCPDEVYGQLEVLLPSARSAPNKNGHVTVLKKLID